MQTQSEYDEVMTVRQMYTCEDIVESILLQVLDEM
jgi:hypothetical protein